MPAEAVEELHLEFLHRPGTLSLPSRSTCRSRILAGDLARVSAKKNAKGTQGICATLMSISD